MPAPAYIYNEKVGDQVGTSADLCWEDEASALDEGCALEKIMGDTD